MAKRKGYRLTEKRITEGLATLRLMQMAKDLTRHQLMDMMAKFQDIKDEDATNVLDALRSMGSGCLFDDMKDDGEVQGALKVLNWIDKFLGA